MFERLRRLLLFFFRPDVSTADAKAGLHAGEAATELDDADSINAARTGLGRVMAFDEGLLERSRTQWQFGDWVSLAQLEKETIQHHPDRAKLALLAAAGHMQLGSMEVSKQFIRLAESWGCSRKMIAQILVAGVHNSLGRAAAVAGMSERSHKHFENAIRAGMPSADAKLLGRARTYHQLADLELGDTISAAPMPESRYRRIATDSKPSAREPRTFEAMQRGRLSLLANEVIAQIQLDQESKADFDVVSHGQFQTIAIGDTDDSVLLLQRDLLSQAKSQHRLPEFGGRAPRLAVDERNLFHLCIGRSDGVRWVRATAADVIGEWTLPAAVPAPTSLRARKLALLSTAQQPLLLVQETGDKRGSNALQVMKYDSETGAWQQNAMIFGAGDHRLLDWLPPVRSRDGALHWVLMLANGAGGRGDTALYHGKSVADGSRWITTTGQTIQAPITVEQLGKIGALPDAPHGLPASMVVDSRGAPHVVYLAEAAHGLYGYQHAWFDGSQWRQQSLFDQQPPAVGKKNTGECPPAIVMDNDDNLIVVHASPRFGGIEVALLPAPDYRARLRAIHSLQTLDVAPQRIKLDLVRWHRDRVISVLALEAPAVRSAAVSRIAGLRLIEFRLEIQP